MDIESRRKKTLSEDASNESDDLKNVYGDDLDDYDGEDFASPTRPDEGDEPEDDYPPNWQLISKQYRDSILWKCERCDISLRDLPHLVHTHHITGTKSNCDEDNLEALCAWCHSQNPGHFHIWDSLPEKDKNFVIARRHARGLTSKKA